MSASWASSMSVTRAGAGRALAAMLALGSMSGCRCADPVGDLAAVTVAHAAERVASRVAAKVVAGADADSEQVIKSLSIDQHGVHVETAKGRRGSRDVDIRIDPKGLRPHIRVSDGDSGVSEHVIGPGIVVDTDGAGLVRVFNDAEVPAGERVEGDVVAVFGSVLVEGAVSGNVVAVFGSVKLTPGAAVEGDVVAVGGVLDQAAGATIGGESVSLGFLPVTFGMPALPVLLLSVLVGWMLSIFVGWLVTLLIPDRMLRVATTASRRGVASFFMGLVATPLMMFACMLLLITVIGIPIALLLPVLFVLMAWAGQIASTYVLGSRLVRRRLGQGGAMKPILIGTLFVAGFFVAGALLATPPGFPRTAALFFSLLGVLLVFCLTTIGTGAFLLSRIGTRPQDVSFEREPGRAEAPPVVAGISIPPTTSEA